MLGATAESEAACANAGGEVEALNTKEVFPQLKENTRQAKDVSRFNKFSVG